jgi:hypothetical protein
MSSLKMADLRVYQVNLYQCTRRCDPEDNHLHTHRRENLKLLVFTEDKNDAFLRLQDHTATAPLWELQLSKMKHVWIIMI